MEIEERVKFEKQREGGSVKEYEGEEEIGETDQREKANQKCNHKTSVKLKCNPKMQRQKANDAQN